MYSVLSENKTFKKNNCSLNLCISLKGVAMSSIISLAEICKFDEISTQCAHIN